jgi:hypothetical protein
MLSELISECYDIGMIQHPEEIREFAELLRSRNNLNHVMEIGSWKGGTFHLLYRLSSGKKISVDLPLTAATESFNYYGLKPIKPPKSWLWPRGVPAPDKRGDDMRARNPGSFILRANSHRPETVKAVEDYLAGDKLDLLFIDANHTYDSVRKDFEKYQHLVGDGGIIAFHDINPPSGVERLWKELEGRKETINHSSEWFGIGILYKSATGSGS